LDDSFDPGRSDLDFLVEFKPLSCGDYATAFLSFKAALEELFGRPIDLVVASAIRNPYFRRSVEKSKIELYAA
jgi:predicted nucleotidyltransferase